MPAVLMDGQKLADEILKGLKNKVSCLREQNKPLPGLGVVLVGDDPASHIYVKHKEKACQKIGFYSQIQQLADNTTQNQLLECIRQFNESEQIHGILVQLPLPNHLKVLPVTEAIAPHKDVDGFHPTHLGLGLLGKETILPCTPYGIMQLINHYTIDLPGKKAVVVGASNIVGKPLGIALLNKGCTLTLCHQKTQNLQEEVKNADILVVATGREHLIPGIWIKKGAIVIDVGIHRQADGTIVGDVDFDKAKDSASYITPVPGGVGPMTIASLMQNTWTLYCEQMV